MSADFDQDFNEHQQKSFCVFSGDGIRQLRNHLNTQMFTLVSDDGSTRSNRRDSESSSSSGAAEEGDASELHEARPRPGAGRLAGHLTLDTVASRHRDHSPGTFSTLAARRSSAQPSRDRPSRSSFDSDHTGLETALASATPNFLSPLPLTTGTANARRIRDRARPGDRTMPGSFSSSSSMVSSMIENDQPTTTTRTERALPPLPTSASSLPQRSSPVYGGQRVSSPAYNSVSAADLARQHRAARLQREAQRQFADSFAQSGGEASQQHDRHGPQSSNGLHYASSSSRSTGSVTPNESRNDMNGLRIGETGIGSGSGGSPLRWVAGFVGWSSERERERERERSNESNRDRA